MDKDTRVADDARHNAPHSLFEKFRIATEAGLENGRKQLADQKRRRREKCEKKAEEFVASFERKALLAASVGRNYLSFGPLINGNFEDGESDRAVDISSEIIRSRLTAPGLKISCHRVHGSPEHWITITW